MDENFKLELKNKFKELVKTSNDFYSDFNFLNREKKSIVVDKINTDINKSNDNGIKFRIFDGNNFLEFATTDFNLNNLENSFYELLNQGNKNFEINKGENKLIDLKINKEIIEKDFSNFNGEYFPIFIEKSLEGKLKIIENIKNDFLNNEGYKDDIVNIRIILNEQLEENIFVNKYKNLYQEIKEYLFAVVLFVKAEDGSIRTIYEAFVSNNLDDVLNKFENNKSEFLKKINQIKFAKKLKGGKYKAILSPKLTGLLAHESFGHGMEADTMIKDRALASDYIGKKIGNEKINIVDYPNILGKHGSFFFDNEGNLARKTYLVKNGVINEPMTDIYSKTKLNLNYSSNSRFESFDHKNYVRMSNTYFEAGDDDLEEMIKSIDDGIFIIDSSGGMEDPKGWGVQIQGNFGQRIKNGELIDEFYDGFALTGFLPDLIKNISSISKEIEIEGGGSCGKGHKEWVRVSEGGPYLKIDEIILG